MKLINPHIRIETTNICDGKCTFCPREKMTRYRTVMDNHHARYLLQQGRVLGATNASLFGYGEPLIDPGIITKIIDAKEMGYDVDITTNAGLLTPKKSRWLLDAGLDNIRFSVHGLKDTYEKVHRGLSWGIVSQNIGEFMKINDSVYNHRCKVHVTVVPMHGESVESIVNHWEPGGDCNLRVDHLEIWKPHNWVNGRAYRKVERKKKSCGRPFKGPIQINADGKMMVCCFDFDGQMIVGDTYKDTIGDILKGEAFERIRAAHRSGDLSGLLCEGCDQLNVESESPLLFSTLDPDLSNTKTSTLKFNLEE